MKKYAVVVHLEIDEDEDAAQVLAHEDFTVDLTDDLEDYEEETLRVEEAA